MVRRAVSASNDQTLKVWDLESGAVLATFTCDAGVFCCAFASQRVIVVGDEGGRVPNGQGVQTLTKCG